MALLFALAVHSSAAAEDMEVRRSFSVASTDAAVALDEFSEQAGAQIVFFMDQVRGVRTNAIHGDFSVAEALDRLLAGTPLHAKEDKKTGALAVVRSAPAGLSPPGGNSNVSPMTNTNRETKSPKPSRKGLLALLVGFASAIGSSAQTAPSPPAPTSANSASPMDEQTVVLSAFDVYASTNVGYGAETTSTSGRTVEAYIDVPQTVNVMTAEFIQDFDILDSKDVLAATPGILLGSSLNNGINELRGAPINSIYMDGLQVDMATTNPHALGGGGITMPVAFFDRVEIVKGPTSGAFGLGESAGVINYIPKTPQGIDATELDFSVGTYNSVRSTLDIQGISAANDKLSYRLVGDFWNAYDGQGPISHSDSLGAQLALKYTPNRSTTILLILSAEQFVYPAYNDISYLHNAASAEMYNYILPAGYVVNPNQPIYSTNGPPDGYVGTNDPTAPYGWADTTATYVRGELSVTKTFGDHLSARLAGALDNYVEQQHLLTPSGADPAAPNTYQTWADIDWPMNGHSERSTLDVTGDFNFLGGHWTTSVGTEAYERWGFDNFIYTNIFYNSGPLAHTPVYVNMYNPTAIGNIGQYTLSNPVEWQWIEYNQGLDYATEYGYSFHGQQNVSFFKDMLTLTAGWRIDYRNYSESDEDVNGAQGVNNYTRTGTQHVPRGAPRASISFKPLKWLSIYSLYSVHKDTALTTPKYSIEGVIPLSVVPDPGANISYTPSGVLFESGIKATLLDGKLTATAAVWHDITDGTLVNIPYVYYATYGGLPQTYDENQVSGTNLHGIELSLTGSVTDRLMFTAGYTYTRGTEPETAAAGQRTPTAANGTGNNVYFINTINPPDNFDVHMKYDFGDRQGNGFYATFGINTYAPFINGQTIDWVGHVFELKYPDWQYTLNAGVGYRWATGRFRHKVSVTAANLTNQFVNLGTVGSAGNYADISGENIWVNYQVKF